MTGPVEQLAGADDLVAQVAQAYLNVAAELAAAGGGFDDVTELTVHVVGLTRDTIPLVKEGIGRAAAESGANLLRPVTLRAVASTREPGCLVAVDAVAVLGANERLRLRETCQGGHVVSVVSGKSATMPRVFNRHVETEDGVKLNVVEAGKVDGPPIVFVHGLASSWLAWKGVFAVPELAEHYQLIAFDVRGHGDSATELAPEQLTAEGMEATAKLWSRDIDAVVAGLRAPVLVGWSRGGGMVQSWLYTHGGLGGAAAAVLACVPSVIGPVPPGDPAEALVSQRALMALARAAEDGSNFAGTILANGAGDPSFSLSQWDSVASVAESTPAEVVAAAMRQGFDFRPFLAGLDEAERDRITAVIADGDQIFASAATETVWQQAGIRTVHVPGAAHALPICEPARFAQVLLDVVARNR